MPVTLVHESESYWTAALERGFRGESEIQFRWRPHPIDLLQEARAHTADACLLVLSTDAAGFELMRQVIQADSGLPVICLINPVERDWEWAARELGAASVLSANEDTQRVMETLRRILNPRRCAAGEGLAR